MNQQQTPQSYRASCHQSPVAVMFVAEDASQWPVCCDLWLAARRLCPVPSHKSPARASRSPGPSRMEIRPTDIETAVWGCRSTATQRIPSPPPLNAPIFLPPPPPQISQSIRPSCHWQLPHMPNARPHAHLKLRFIPAIGLAVPIAPQQRRTAITACWPQPELAA